MDTKIFFEKFKRFFLATKSWKNTSKSCLLMTVWLFFLSAAPPATNSPEVHFCFINYPIHSSVLKSVIAISQPIVRSYFHCYMLISFGNVVYFWLECFMDIFSFFLNLMLSYFFITFKRFFSCMRSWNKIPSLSIIYLPYFLI